MSKEKDNSGSEDEKDSRPSCGLQKKRSCTDIFFLIFFLLFVGGMGYGIYIGILQGDPYKIVYGLDSWGNVCNRNNEKIANADFSGKNLIGKKKIFFFEPTIFLSKIPGYEKVYGNRDDKVALSVCVKDCPEKTLFNASEYNNYATSTGTSYCRYDVDSYNPDDAVCPALPIEKSTDLLNRCIPSAIVNMIESKFSSSPFLGGFSGVSSFSKNVINAVRVTWEDILILCAIAFGVSLLIVFLMWILAAVVIWIIIIAIAAFSLASTAYCWYTWYDLKEKADTTNVDLSEKIEMWLIYGGISSGVTVILLLILLVMRKRIALVVQLFKESGKAIKCMPLLLLQPILTLIVTLSIVAILIVAALFMETSDNLEVFNNTDLVVEVENSQMQILKWYHYFGIIWIVAFIIACQDMVIGGAVATWYFTRDKREMHAPIWTSIKRLLRYHLGSIAFGSLLIALVTAARIVLAYVQNRLRGKEGPVAKFVLKALACCLWCFQKFLAFINRNAYIEIAIYGYSFCKAARNAFMVILKNALRAATLNSVGDFVLFLGKVITVVIVMVIGNEMLKERKDIQEGFYWVPLTIACAFGFCISHCFLLVYEITLDSIFLCFCEDCEENDGVEKPYYMSKALMKYMEVKEKPDV